MQARGAYVRSARNAHAPGARHGPNKHGPIRGAPCARLGPLLLLPAKLPPLVRASGLCVGGG